MNSEQQITWLKFEAQTNRTKCLMHWEWNAKTGVMDKATFFYNLFGFTANELNIHKPQNLCYACKQANFNCLKCPIHWAPKTIITLACKSYMSPYRAWVMTSDTTDKTKYATEICHLIINTWEL